MVPHQSFRYGSLRESSIAGRTLKVFLLLSLLSAAPVDDQLWTVYFQEHCLPCRKQLRELDCFAAQGRNIRVVGVGENRLRLQNELERFTKRPVAFEFKTWQEARELGIQGTPSHTKTGPDGRIERFSGLVTCAKR